MLRFEYKYFVPYEQLQKLRSMLTPFMDVDAHAAQSGGEYTVRSIYFDTPELECYYQKMAGVKRRNKIRLRGYNNEGDEDTVFFEIKKKVDDPLFKNRAGMSFGTAKQILRGAAMEGLVSPTKSNPLAEENARRFLYHIHARRMQPVVTVIYEREPYQSILKDRKNDLRITFDKNLRGVPYPKLEKLFEEEHSVPVDPRRFILEVKFNQYLPSWAKAIITCLGLSKGPASKYVMCMDAVHQLSKDNHKIAVGGWRRAATMPGKNGHPNGQNVTQPTQNQLIK